MFEAIGTSRHRLRSTLSLALVASTSSLHAIEFQGQVASITDGDTVVLISDGGRYKVRLADMDAPESAQPGGGEAQRALAKKLFRQRVTVDARGIDKYGRLVGRVFLNGRDISKEMVRDGHAWAVPGVAYKETTLVQEEDDARQSGRGLWKGRGQAIAPWEWRRNPTGPPRNQDPFSCGVKRYCKDLKSCEEALFLLNECGMAGLDRDSDGTPCEAICK